MRRKMLMLLSVLAVMAWFGAVPATAGELSGTSADTGPAPALESTPAGCGEALDLAFLTQSGGTCPALGSPLLSPQPAAPPFRLRTCRCSCGYPCKTDADCGPGGICSAGVTCC